MRKYYFAILIIALGFTACINTNEPTQSNNPDITFSVKSGTATLFTSVSFGKTVVFDTNGKDTLYMLVTNTDSLPYLTKPDSLVPVISGNSLSSIKITINDSTFNYDSSKPDTLDFSDTVQIVTVSQDEKRSMTFKVVVNIHQKDPDLYVWTPLKNQIYTENAIAEKLVLFDSLLYLYVKTATNVVLYTSENGENWSRKTLSNFPNTFDIKYIVRNLDKLYIAEGQEVYVSDDGISWTKNDVTNSTIHHLAFALNGQIFGLSGNPNILQILDAEITSWSRTIELPIDFPVEGASICVSNSVAGNERVFLVGGKDADGNLLRTVFSSENGFTWRNLSSINPFSARQDVAAIQYDNVLMAFGGRNNDGVLGLDEYFRISPDFGITWRNSYENMTMPIDLMPRFNCQVVINDAKTKMYFVGGQNDSGFVKDAWVVMKNSVLWKPLEEE